MSRQNKDLLKASSAAADGQWVSTDGRLRSVDAMLAEGGTAAVVEIYGSNLGRGTGVLIGTITLSSGTPSDGLTFGPGEDGWWFVRAKLASTTGGLSGCAACVGE